MSATTMPTSGQQRYKYGGGMVTLILGIVIAYGVFSAYEPFTSGRVEWHLYLKSLPAIPHPVMVGLWWICLAAAVFIIVLSLLPSVMVVTDDEKIVTQILYTRNFKIMYYRDMLDIVYHKNYLNITDRNNKKIYIAKLFMSAAAFKAVKDKVLSSAANAL